MVVLVVVVMVMVMVGGLLGTEIALDRVAKWTSAPNLLLMVSECCSAKRAYCSCLLLYLLIDWVWLTV